MTNEKATGRDSDKIMLRVPDGMRDRIATAAKINNRSMNAEIVSRLQASFEIEQDPERSLKNLKSFSLHGREVPTTALEDVLKALDESRKAFLAFAHDAHAEQSRADKPSSSDS